MQPSAVVPQGKDLVTMMYVSGLTQRQIAKYAGVSPTAIGRVYRGERALSKEAFDNLSKLLKVEPSTAILLVGAWATGPDSDALTVLVQRINDLAAHCDAQRRLKYHSDTQ
jgi:transcriptional regulator with XRE-family HTH domain